MSDFRSVERVDNVRLYRQVNRWGRFKDKDKGRFDDKGDGDEDDPYGTTMATMPGAIIVGTKQATVRDTVKRMRGKGGEAALSSTPSFRKTAKLRERPGLFLYADCRAIAAQCEKQLQAEPDSSFGQFWRGLETTINPKAIVRGRQPDAQRDGLDLQAHLQHDEGRARVFLVARQGRDPGPAGLGASRRAGLRCLRLAQW